jgi:hypothetical protein
MGCIWLIGSIFFVGIGAWFLLFPDAAWSWQEGASRRRGLASERTPEWKQTNKIGSIAVVIIGIVIFLLGISGAIH